MSDDESLVKGAKYEEVVTAAFGAMLDTLTDESEYLNAVAAVGMHAMVLFAVRGGVDSAKAYAELLSKIAEAPEFAVATLMVRSGMQQPA